MVTFTNAPRRDVRTPLTGVVKSYIAGGRIPFGSYVIRAGAGTVKAAILEQTLLGGGFALEDEEEHTYAGFYEAGEMVPVAMSGEVNANIIVVGAYNILAFDYLDVVDITSTTNAAELGLLSESNTSAGETKLLYDHAMALEDVTLGSATYKTPSATPTAGTRTIAMTSGDPTLMGIQVGDMVLLRDANGTDSQVNLITAITDTQITVRIPITTAACDIVHAVRQGLVLIMK